MFKLNVRDLFLLLSRTLTPRTQQRMNVLAFSFRLEERAEKRKEVETRSFECIIICCLVLSSLLKTFMSWCDVPSSVLLEDRRENTCQGS